MKNIIKALQNINTSLFEQLLPFFEQENNTVLMYNQNYHISFKIKEIENEFCFGLYCSDENGLVVKLIIKEEELENLEILKPKYIKFLTSASSHQSKQCEKYKDEYIKRIKYLIENTNYRKIDKYQEFLFVCGTDDGTLFSIKGTNIFIRIYGEDELDVCVINKSSVSYLKRHRILKMLTILTDIYIFG